MTKYMPAILGQVFCYSYTVNGFTVQPAVPAILVWILPRQWYGVAEMH